MYSGDVWRAGSSSDHDVKTFARLAMRRKAHFFGFLSKNFEHRLHFPSLHAVPYGDTYQKFRRGSVSFFFLSF